MIPFEAGAFRLWACMLMYRAMIRDTEGLSGISRDTIHLTNTFMALRPAKQFSNIPCTGICCGYARVHHLYN